MSSLAELIIELALRLLRPRPDRLDEIIRRHKERRKRQLDDDA